MPIHPIPPVKADVDRTEEFVIKVVTHELDSVGEIASGLAALYAGEIR